MRRKTDPHEFTATFASKWCTRCGKGENYRMHQPALWRLLHPLKHFK